MFGCGIMRLDDFEVIDFNEKVLDENGNELPNFRASRLISCYWSSYRDHKNDEEPLPISDELDVIFTVGSKEHYEDEVLTRGAGNIAESEKEMKLLHKSKRFTISGHFDYKKFDMFGMYYEDLKTSKVEGFYFFVKCVETGLSKDYIRQLSIYAYEDAHYTGYYVDRGVVTRVLKRLKGTKDTRIIRMSIEDKLMSFDETREFILRHPVILTVMGVIDEERLIELCKVQMVGTGWKCTNCQYKTTKECSVFATL